ncbi:beta-N-acetylhexosaminidase [Nitrosococcus watsonii]|uniref:Beta-hexosaminidase n=1 Tax=Nitrosococcus watsoni (strain C-113) TaxID=105559 RepID=D8K4F0_NITWC|nr:beta-N-acetylhexosaminidase [Nitrosococcus watsonii]ADJ27847.1 glycoside hydrolase family 3 domain protein [Nitrosococcus watsonii C-113]
MTLGPLMVDLKGVTLDSEERAWLGHPWVGGVILFSRNYESPEQIAALIKAIHALKKPRLLVAVDHEGGRVQRFRDGFTLLPSASLLGKLYDRDQRQAQRLAMTTGWLMAVELRAIGVDVSFAPVLDLAQGVSAVIGDRAFHAEPDAVIALARAYIRGMAWAGMAAVGKHFPGHGSVVADSHTVLPVDERPWRQIRERDLLPFEYLVKAGLPAVMPAHVCYASVDARPAGFSPFWLETVLRGQLGFQGAIISDDLSMAGAAEVGNMSARVRTVLGAGCDMALVCNDPDGYALLLDELNGDPYPQIPARLLRLYGRYPLTRSRLYRSPAWQKAVRTLAAYGKF